MTALKIACVALCLFIATALRASEEAHGEKKAGGHGEKKADGHGEKKEGGHGEKKAEGHGGGKGGKKGGGHGGAAPAEEEAAPTFNDREYVHAWIKFPEIVGKAVGKDTMERFVPQPGRISVVIFTASWCGPCQKVMDDLQRLEDKYSPLFTNFLYIYTHDTAQDAYGAMQEFKVSRAILANHQILSDFHNPVAPTVYVADRTGWIQARFPRRDPAKEKNEKSSGNGGRLDTKDIEELDNYLRAANSY